MIGTWIRASETLAGRLVRTKAVSDPGSAAPTQVIAVLSRALRE